MLAVVGFHVFPKAVKGGFVGVDIFFVISGFLISTIIFGSLERNSFSFLAFYSRRIKRIFPALALVLITVFILGWFTLLADEYKQLGKHIAAGAGFVSNFVLWNESGYFDNGASTKPLLHLWSLGIEEQFYIIWPLLLWAAWKKRFNLLTITLLIALVSFVLNIRGMRTDAVATFYSPQTRFWELLAGSLLAWRSLYGQTALSKLKHKSDYWYRVIAYFPASKLTATSKLTDSTLRNIQSALGAVLIVLAAYFSRGKNFPGWWALMPILGAVLVISAGAQAWVNRTILSSRILVWIGLISYPLYLWHWPLLSFVRITSSEKLSGPIRISVVIISIVLAWLTYRFIEKPMRFGKYSRTKTISLVVLMTIVGCVGYSTYVQNGFGFRFKELSGAAEIFADPLPAVKDFDCKKMFPELSKFDFDGGCRLSKKSAPDMIFIGDSHTLHYANAIWKQFPNNSVMTIVHTSCLPFSSDSFLHKKDKRHCEEKFDAVIAFLKSNSSIKKVYLSGYWGYLMSGGAGKRGINWHSPKPLDAEASASFKRNGTHFISSILQANKEIIFLKDIPNLDFNIKSCYRPFNLPIGGETRPGCTIDFADYKKRSASYEKVIDELLENFPQVKVYDPTPLFCKKDKCFSSDGLLPYYFNGDHLNWYGADMVIKDLLIKTEAQ